MLCLTRKRHIKGAKHIVPMDFAEYLRKSDVSENKSLLWAISMKRTL